VLSQRKVIHFAEELRNGESLVRATQERNCRQTDADFFWIANGFVALWLFTTLGGWGKMVHQPMSHAEEVGSGLGIIVGLGVIFSIWACVAAVTGLLAFMTRGPKEIVEVER
jgi:hypothetical protein